MTARRPNRLLIGVTVVCSLALGLARSEVAGAYFGKIGQWGSKGDGPGQFQYANAIATGPQGDVYVADSGDNRIEQFTAGGTFVRQWGQGTPAFSSAPGQFHAPPPLDLAVDRVGDVYVFDGGNGRIQKFTADGQLLDANWAADAGYLATDTAGNIYVSSTPVRKYAPDGTLLATIAAPAGTGAIAVDAHGNVYVGDADVRPPGIYEYSPSGAPIRRFGFGGLEGGSADGQFSASGPRAVAIAPNGTVWASDGSRIEEFAANGKFISSCGRVPTDPVPAADLAFGPNGELYLAAGFNAFVARYGDVSPPDKPCDDTAPKLSRFRFSPSRFRIAPSRRLHRRGTLIRYQLSERARITLTIRRSGRHRLNALAAAMTVTAGRHELRSAAGSDVEHSRLAVIARSWSRPTVRATAHGPRPQLSPSFVNAPAGASSSRADPTTLRLAGSSHAVHRRAVGWREDPRDRPS